MIRPSALSHKAQIWPDYSKALSRGGRLTTWFDPFMTWSGKPIGRHGRQPILGSEKDQKAVWKTVFATNAIQTCLTMKVLFGMTLLSCSTPSKPS